MTVERDSYNRILASTAIMFGATIAIIAIGVVRTKVFALLIGPAGIGLMGLLASVMATAAAIGGMGLGFSGVREIAASPDRRSIVRRALWFAAWPLALLTALVVWFGRFEISQWVGLSEDHALGVGLIGVAAALSIVAAVQTAQIQGLGRVGDIAKVRVGGAVLALLLGMPAVVWLGPLGIVLAVAAVPVGNVLAALPYRPRPENAAAVPGKLTDEWRRLMTLGATIMVTSALGAGQLVAVRVLVIHQDGIQAAGLYQAAYAISALNASLVLSAMATDYFPRLSGTEQDRLASATLVNQHLHAALLLGSPLLLGMAALAPLVLRILYSDAFTESADLLRWQLAGELLKLPGWALGFLLIARADNSRYLLFEASFAAVFVGATFLLLPLLGLAGAGVSYFLAYVLYSLLVAAICSRRHDARLSVQNSVHLLVVAATMVTLALIGPSASWIAVSGGLAAAAGAGMYAWRHLNEIRRSPAPAALPLSDGLQSE